MEHNIWRAVTLQGLEKRLRKLSQSSTTKEKAKELSKMLEGADTATILEVGRAARYLEELPTM